MERVCISNDLLREEHTHTFLVLADLTKKLADIIPKDKDCYPVLGAHGHEPFIEVSYGEFSNRTIIVTVYIQFGRILSIPPGESPCSNELIISLPQLSDMLGFLLLLEAKLKKKPMLVFPLNTTGDLYGAWECAMNKIVTETA